MHCVRGVLGCRVPGQVVCAGRAAVAMQLVGLRAAAAGLAGLLARQGVTKVPCSSPLVAWCAAPAGDSRTRHDSPLPSPVTSHQSLTADSWTNLSS